MSSSLNGVVYMDYIPCKKCLLCANYGTENGKHTCTPGNGKLEYSGKGEAVSTKARTLGVKIEYDNCEHFIPKNDVETLRKNKVINGAVLAILVVIMGSIYFISQPIEFIKKFWPELIASLCSLPIVLKMPCIVDEGPKDLDKTKKKSRLIGVIIEICLIAGNFKDIKASFCFDMVALYVILFVALFFLLDSVLSLIITALTFFQISRESKAGKFIYFVVLMLLVLLINEIVGVFHITISPSVSALETSSAVEVIHTGVGQ